MTYDVLQVRDLTKSLKSPSHRFDLIVPGILLKSGRFYGLVGKSGSGKSTMLDILAMVSLPTSVGTFDVAGAEGKIDISHLLDEGDDRRISEVRLKSFGYILQSGGLFEFLTVRQNLELPKQMAGLCITAGETEALAKSFEMVPHIDKFPRELSGGQRQRVSVLRALSLAPPPLCWRTSLPHQ